MVEHQRSEYQRSEQRSLEQRRFAGTAAELHALPIPTEGDAAELWIMEPTSSAVVMGSSQRPDIFDQERLRKDGVALAARRSGGGAVYIAPSSTVWIDLVAPRSSRFWSSDLAENFLLVGRLWQKAFRSLGVATDLCVAAPGRTEASTLACWAGTGWGELTIGGAKVVGLSQRRTRWGSRVQSMAVLDGSSARVSDYLMPLDQTIVRDSLQIHDLGLKPAAVEAAILQAFTTS